jgi:hypothetical protein
LSRSLEGGPITDPDLARLLLTKVGALDDDTQLNSRSRRPFGDLLVLRKELPYASRSRASAPT